MWSELNPSQKTVLYAVYIAGAIVLGSVLTMQKLELPWWAWVIEFLALLPITWMGSKRKYAHQKD